MTHPSFQELKRRLAGDVAAHYPPDSPHRNRPGRAFCHVFVTSQGFRLTILHRLAWYCRPRWGVAGKLLSKGFFWLGCVFYKCSLAGTADIGGGLIFPHPQGIVIGPGVVIGPRSWVFQQVTVGGGGPQHAGVPRIGADARIYTGAVVVGPIIVGPGVAIGANAVVSVDVSENAFVAPPRPTIKPNKAAGVSNDSDG